MPSQKLSSRPFIPDERQRQAIEHVHGPMLVVAGAGTGKTSVLTHRIERLVREGGASLLSVGPTGKPVLGKASGARVLICQVPEDIVELRRKDPALARAWRASKAR